ncbi:MAG: response regulator transcription factor [Saprospiraceae bacterium]|nr:response regulator transcription factor [Saprospiraceae bacterium]
MKYNFAIIEDDIEIQKMISNYFAQSNLLDCVMVVDTVEKFLKYHREFLDIKLVLLDISLHGQSSIYSIPRIQQRNPDGEIIMFTITDDTNLIFQAFAYGATGYLLKGMPMPDLERSLYSVLAGEGSLLSPAVAKKIIKNFIYPSSNALQQTEALTEREQIVIHQLKDGHTYNEIAQKLGLSINGVRYYIKSIYRKLQINSRGELLRK